MKDKTRILNEMVEHAADIMELKMEYQQLMIEQYIEKGDIGRLEHWQNEHNKTEECVNFMRDRGGCWA